jgi:hypothetical protein
MFGIPVGPKPTFLPRVPYPGLNGYWSFVAPQVMPRRSNTGGVATTRRPRSRRNWLHTREDGLHCWEHRSPTPP